MAPETEVKNPALDINDEYKYGFSDPEKAVFKAEKGVNHDVVDQISQMKSEPEWMREFRHDALDVFESKPMPNWGNTGLLNDIDFDNIYYYLKPVEKQGTTWDEVPED